MQVLYRDFYIDWDNPINRGLVIDWVSARNQQSPYNNAMRHRMMVNGTVTQASIVRTKFGRPTNFSNGGFSIGSLSNPVPYIRNFSTLSVEFIFLGTTSGIFFDHADISSWDSWFSVESNNLSHTLYIFYPNREIRWQTGNHFSSTTTYYHVFYLYDHRDHTNQPIGWVNGSPMTFSNTLNNQFPQTLSEGYFTIGSTIYQSVRMNGNMYLFRYWGRMLTTSEIFQLYADPYRIYRKIPKRIFVINQLVLKSLSDSVAGTDTQTIQSQATQQESGGGSDAQQVSSLSSLSDSVGGLDTQTIQSQTGVNDAGGGSDTQSVTAQATRQDSGTGEDDPVVQNDLSLSEATTGADVFSLAISTVLSENGSGSDAVSSYVSLVEKMIADQNATVSEAVSIAAFLLLAESGASVETMTQAASFLIQEYGNATDVLFGSFFASLTDTGTMQEFVQVATAVLQSDASVAAEAVGMFVTLLLSDFVSGNDVANFLASVSLASSAMGVDVASMLANFIAEEQGAGTESLSLFLQKIIEDYADGEETLSLATSKTLADVGVLLEHIVASPDLHAQAKIALRNKKDIVSFVSRLGKITIGLQRKKTVI